MRTSDPRTDGWTLTPGKAPCSEWGGCTTSTSSTSLRPLLQTAPSWFLFHLQGDPAHTASRGARGRWRDHDGWPRGEWPLGTRLSRGSRPGSRWECAFSRSVRGGGPWPLGPSSHGRGPTGKQGQLCGGWGAGLGFRGSWPSSLCLPPTPGEAAAWPSHSLLGGGPGGEPLTGSTGDRVSSSLALYSPSDHRLQRVVGAEAAEGPAAPQACAAHGVPGGWRGVCPLSWPPAPGRVCPWGPQGVRRGSRLPRVSWKTKRSPWEQRPGPTADEQGVHVAVLWPREPDQPTASVKGWGGRVGSGPSTPGPQMRVGHQRGPAWGTCPCPQAQARTPPSAPGPAGKGKSWPWSGFPESSTEAGGRHPQPPGLACLLHPVHLSYSPSLFQNIPEAATASGPPLLPTSRTSGVPPDSSWGTGGREVPPPGSPAGGRRPAPRGGVHSQGEPVPHRVAALQAPSVREAVQGVVGDPGRRLQGTAGGARALTSPTRLGSGVSPLHSVSGPWGARGAPCRQEADPHPEWALGGPGPTPWA